MPLFDHFHPPLYPHHHWESFHSNWATRIADGIAALLPPEFQVEEHTHAGPGFAIAVAAFEGEASAAGSAVGGPALATRAALAYAPPAPDRTMPAAFPDTFEVRVFSTTAGLTLVAVIELVRPGNKDRPAERRAFAAKCAGGAQVIQDAPADAPQAAEDEVLLHARCPSPPKSIKTCRGNGERVKMGEGCRSARSRHGP